MSKSKSLFFVFCLILPLVGFCNDNFTHQKDVVYGYKDGLALVMDVYTPDNKQNNAGIIVVVAGGMTSHPEYAHQVGNRADVQSLLHAGYVVFATTHSSQPKYTADEIKYDISRAVRFIRFNTNWFNIHPDKIGIIGYSSGGHVSLMAGLSPPPPDSNSKDSIENISSDIQAVVAYYPSTDLLNFGTNKRTILEHFHSAGYNIDAAFDFHFWDDNTKRFERVENAEKLKDYYRQNSPISHVSNDDPPTLLIHGDKDKLVPLQQSEFLYRDLKEAGVLCKLIVVSDQGHGFGIRNPELAINDILRWFNHHLLQ